MLKSRTGDAFFPINSSDRDVIIELFDLTGTRKVREIIGGQKGDQKGFIRAYDPWPGMYIMTITSGDVRVRRNITIL